MDVPFVGERGEVTISRISNNGNALVELDDEGHINVGPVHCLTVEEGDTVEVKRLNERYAKCVSDDTGIEYDVEFQKVADCSSSSKNSTDSVKTADRSNSKTSKDTKSWKGENKNHLASDRL